MDVCLPDWFAIEILIVDVEVSPHCHLFFSQEDLQLCHPHPELLEAQISHDMIYHSVDVPTVQKPSPPE